eukprot:1140589-Pelagomonas_calceolata.AAC.2
MPHSLRMLQDGVVDFTPRRFLRTLKILLCSRFSISVPAVRSGPYLAGIHSCWDSTCFQKPDECMQPICEVVIDSKGLNTLRGGGDSRLF